MSKTPKSKDPHAKREAQNYANPIPSREYIIQLLEKIGEPIGHLPLGAPGLYAMTNSPGQAPTARGPGHDDAAGAFGRQATFAIS